MKPEGGHLVAGASKFSRPEQKGGPGAGGRWTAGLATVSGQCSGSLVGPEERNAMESAVMGEFEDGKHSWGDWYEWGGVCKQD